MDPDAPVAELSFAATEEAVIKVADTLEASLDGLVDEMLAAYRERIPSYADASEEVIEGVREWAGGSVLMATGIVRGTLTASDFYEALRDVGRRRAGQGFPLHEVLLANLVATEVLWNKVMELSPEDSAARAQIQSTFLKATILLLQQAVSALSAGYLEVEEARVADEEHDMQVLVETLAGLRRADRRHEERAEQRGIDLKALKWCAVARTDGDVGDQVRLLRRSAAAGVVGRVGRRIIAFLPGETAPSIEIEPIGLASAEDTTTGYRRANAALQVALHLKRPQVLYEEVVPLAMVLAGPEEDRKAFVGAQLGPLLQDPLGSELLKSLEAFYAAGQSVAAAARDLYVHRHTLEYRLARIETVLARDIKAPHTRMLLELAITLADR
ncbi:MAG: PucR family transcriptional regulator [Actinomycetota bacterium]